MTIGTRMKRRKASARCFNIFLWSFSFCLNLFSKIWFFFSHRERELRFFFCFFIILLSKMIIFKIFLWGKQCQRHKWFLLLFTSLTKTIEAFHIHILLSCENRELHFCFKIENTILPERLEWIKVQQVLHQTQSIQKHQDSKKNIFLELCFIDLSILAGRILEQEA